MDPIKAEKKYRKSYQFLGSLILHLLVGLACSFFFSSPYWLPSLCSSTKHFLLISLPCIWSSFFSPKCLFVVVNVIVIFLVGESRLVGSNSSQAPDIYNEYVERSRSFRRLTPQQKIMSQETRVEEVEKEAEFKEVVNKNRAEDKEVKEVEVKEVITAEAQEVKLPDDREVHETYETVEEEEEAGEEKRKDIVEEETGLPAEELNKRVEDFIARVNKQRWLEAQLLVCVARHD